MPPADTTADSATIDRLCSALATETRRAVLAYFETSTTQTASLEGLTDYVAARQSDSRTREQVQLRLHHAGLPKLNDTGLIDYDARTQTVRYRERNIGEWALVAEGLE
ncbi:DUF7344 domain-containing protein [Halosimplex amylolyticum]|uniref:DUF7344 domain-containing protein n=1 Tax=Halosimplex amylolyticum TaxID=3396616 RepID=UPI003F572C7A